MKAVAFVLVLAQASLAGDYDAVFKTRQASVVLVTSDGCPPCQSLEANLFSILHEAGLLRKVTVACVVVQREPVLARRLGAGRGTPRLWVYRVIGKTRYGWRLVGYRGQRETAAWLQAVWQWKPSSNQGEVQ